MHSTAYEEVRKFVSRLSQDSPLAIADIGAYDVNGCLRPLFTNPGWSYTGIDVSPGPNVDIVVGHDHWPNIADETYDVLVSVSTLEHTKHPWLVVQEMFRITKKGGIACIVAPYGWEHHAHPIDCYRFFVDGMRALMDLAGYEITDCFHVAYDVPLKGDTVGIGVKPPLHINKHLESPPIQMNQSQLQIDQLYLQAKQTPSDINEHVERLRELGEACSHITELGVRYGNSTLAWVAARPKKLICYDVCRCAIVDRIEQATKSTQVEFVFHEQDVRHISIEPTDLLFIDTLHVYDQLKVELALHADKARKYIVLHDTETFGQHGELPNSLGLWPAVEEFLAAHPEWTLHERRANNNGLTVLARREITAVGGQAARVILGIPTLWRYELLDRLIESALTGSRAPDEILVVDNGGNYEPKDSRVRVIYCGSNLGVAASWNLLLRAGAWIISNDDVVFTRRTFEELAGALESGTPFVNGLGWALFGQRPEIVEKIGFYDERFFPAYYEDNDYEIRLIDAGIATNFPVLSEPVDHVGWASSRRREDGALLDPAAHHAIFQKSCQAFIDKWGGLPDQVKDTHLRQRAANLKGALAFDATRMPETAALMPEARVFRPAFSPTSCYILRDDEEAAYFTRHGGAPEAPLIDWATQFVCSDQSLIDIGAHVGSWTQHFARKGGRVYAFEPQRTTYERLCEGIRLAALPNVVCRDVALGARGEMDLHHVSIYGGGSTLRHRGELGPELAVERVRSAQLDDYIFDDVGLIKIDAEGMEADILCGAEKTLKAHDYPFLLLEAWLHGWFAKERAALIAQVEAFGYHVQPVMNCPEMLLAEHATKRAKKKTPDQVTTDRPLLGLVMIVKNEAARIAEVLHSYRSIIGHWSILDTGSTDGTQDIIRRELAGIPGDLHEEPFIDFAASRNRALELHGTATQFAIMPNGDSLVGAEALRTFLEARRNDDATAYKIRIAPGHYYHPLVMRTGRGWHYEGRTHECLHGVGDGGQIPDVMLMRDRSQRTDAEWKVRWTRDIDLLKLDIAEKPGDPRGYFYLGQTYDCLGQYEDALTYYSKRATMGGYFDETFETKLRIGKMCEKLDRPWNQIVAAYLDAHTFDPRRAEPLCCIAEHYHKNENHSLAYLFASRAAELPKPATDLFLDEDVYRWKAADLASIHGYYLDDAHAKTKGRELAEQCVRVHPGDERLRANWAFYAPSAAQMFAGYSSKPIVFKPEEPWVTSNPSIFYDGSWRCIARTVNYKLIDGSYIAPDGVIRTRNFMLDLDGDLNVINSTEMIDKTDIPRSSYPVRGFEDCRLFKHEDKLCFTATVCDFDLEKAAHGPREIVIGELDADYSIIGATPLRGPWSHLSQKNWMPRSGGPSSKAALVYAASSNNDGGQATVFDLDGTKADYRGATFFGHGRLRGGSQLVSVPEGWLCLVHDVAWPGSWRLYLHRFVLLSNDYKLISMTDPFYFKKKGIEFCAGLAFDGKKLVASFGVEDRAAHFGVFDLEAVCAQLRTDYQI
jgi:FkbM family methyltransferase